MNLRNTSPYHTATLRAIVNKVFLNIESGSGQVYRGHQTKVIVVEGRTRLRAEWVQDTRVATLRIATPKLAGDEFIALLRQQHGMEGKRYSNPADPKFGQPIKTHGALTSDAFACVVQRAVYEVLRTHVPGRANIGLEVRVRLALRNLPQFIPLRVRKEPKEEAPRNIVQERYQRVLELETKWQRKIKLAQTKLKKLRQKRKHYEKKLNV